MRTGRRWGIALPALALVLLLPPMLAAPARAVPEAPDESRAAIMDSARVASLVHEVRAARRGRVEHTVWRTRAVKFPTTRACVYTTPHGPAIALLNPNWTTQFANALALEQAQFGVTGVRGFCARDTTRHDDLTVTFYAGRAEVVAWLYLDAGYARFEWGDQRSPMLSLKGRGDLLKKLLVEVLPADTLVRSLAVCGFGTADSLVAPSFGPGAYLDSLPQVVQQTQPDYPLSAQDAGVDGTVRIEALIGEDGGVHATAILTSIPMLDPGAVRSVEQWSFEPAHWFGRPISVWVVLPVTFTLH